MRGKQTRGHEPHNPNVFTLDIPWLFRDLQRLTWRLKSRQGVGAYTATGSLAGSGYPALLNSADGLTSMALIIDRFRALLSSAIYRHKVEGILENGRNIASEERGVRYQGVLVSVLFHVVF